ncbi:Succinylglutamate desuccinylase / Aspartoacylase family protein [Halogranum amylolyticum]|uniref:Succinylglutamate desuccinylase / Aspartoacylase family protein n=1 Tax=Halogranum amylolyticum TaxID=660520 RepID=A0A1H8P847_9EURY|nr:PKD domain-containing protein [Halogranum amylolyticum]SEO38056.1 Succinylglutamate desuccinylase / Aspartoacylase family protein [Halogranum amylolyticum]
MVEHEPTRRAFLATTGVAFAGLGASTVAGDSGSVTNGSFSILEGTAAETAVHVTTADADGPTVVVVGGLHGDEEGGYRAATNIAEWEIESGQLVVIPRANARAIERGTRTAADGVDLNREFPTGRDPTYELAQTIWNVITEYDPDVFVDLQESFRLYDGDASDGVGQAVFRSLDVEAAAKAGEAVRHVNENYVENDTNDFEIGYFSAPEVKPNGLLAHKVARDLDSLGFLVETLSSGPALETRVEWHEAVVRKLAEEELFDGDAGAPEDDDDREQPPAEDDQQPPEDENEDVPTDDEGEDDSSEEPPNEKPTPVIETTPSKAETLDLARGDTVTFTASASTDTDGEIATYEWDLDGDGRFEQTGDTAELTLNACGDYPVTLRVTDDEGATQTTGLTVSTEGE